MTDAVPPYGGSADDPVRADVGSDDVAELIVAERQKLDGVAGEILDRLQAGDATGVRVRLGGFVRETLEHLSAVERVVWPAVPGDDGLRGEQVALVGRLRDHDAFHPDVDDTRVRELLGDVRDHLRRQAEELGPRLHELPEDERRRLGADLRQVAG